MMGGDVKYKEPPLLLRNNGHAVFEDMQAEAGSAFRTGYNGRGWRSVILTMMAPPISFLLP